MQFRIGVVKSFKTKEELKAFKRLGRLEHKIQPIRLHAISSKNVCVQDAKELFAQFAKAVEVSSEELHQECETAAEAIEGFKEYFMKQ